MLNEDSFKDIVGSDNTFNPSKSYAFKNKSRPSGLTYDVPKYLTVKGYLAEDAFEILPNKGVRHEFVLGNTVNNNEALKSSDGKYHTGRLGFASASQWRSSVLYQWWRYFENENVCLHVTEDKDKNVKQSVVAIGVTPPKNRLFLSYKNPRNSDWNRAYISDFTVESKPTRWASSQLMIDSASDKIRVPRWTFDRAVELFNAQYDNITAEYYVQCNKAKSLGFQISNATIEIPFENLVEKLHGDSRFCRLLIGKVDWDLIYLGMPFFINRGVCMDHSKDNVLSLYDAGYRENNVIFDNAEENGAYVWRHDY
ncbi:unnamed protein product [Bursaphelenchus okinawaensis]|uniref:Peptidase A1 domain-containing protein n=1 Tax=Bursaphelenchus okinawaensis TaxID=465554 RepID=A0A811KPL9_9BILA|nr:unnamed protein product [Bursaphelenchus okinawaensis]CAG9109367.1 unnamed protein product [Bursaphelenchus okinawaensis]